MLTTKSSPPSKGVIHRDLKPANIKITPEGTVKVLDFGLAKAFAGEAAEVSVSNSPTLSMQATQQGLILGTAAYMAPEQAKGRATDKRADIWAFGCVLFEMLTGGPAFDGEDVSEILASVIKAEVNLDRLPADAHPGVRRLIARCLEKDPKKRFRDIGDVEYELRQVLADPHGVEARPHAEVRRSSGWGWVAALAGMAAVGVAAWYLRPEPEGSRVQFVVSAAPAPPLAVSAGFADVAISADGRYVAYTAYPATRADGLRLPAVYLRPIDAVDGAFVGPAVGIDNPVFSPDGRWLAFGTSTDSSLKRVPVGGGAVETIASWGGYILSGASWGADGTIVFAATPLEGLMQVTAIGAEPAAITREADGEQHLWPETLPGGDVLFTIFTGQNPEDKRIAVLDRDSGAVQDLIPIGTHPRYVETGHMVYGVGSTLYAVPFDPDRLEVRGDPVQVLENVAAKVTGAMGFDVSANGSLIYVPGEGVNFTGERILALVERDGAPRRLDVPPNAYLSPRLSPDGTRLAVQTDGENTVVWTYDLWGETAIQRLAFDGNNYRPLWTPDGERIAFASDREGYHVVPTILSCCES